MLLLLFLLQMMQSPATGPELFAEVLGTLAAACDAFSNSSSHTTAVPPDGLSDVGGGLPAIDQLVPVHKLLALAKACLVPGKGSLYPGQS
jgi:hypothetical protein